MTSFDISSPDAAATASPRLRRPGIAGHAARATAGSTARLAEAVARLQDLAERLALAEPAPRDECAVLARLDVLRRDLARALATVAARLLRAGAYDAANVLAEAAGTLEREGVHVPSAGRPRVVAERLLAVGRACLTNADAVFAPEPRDLAPESRRADPAGNGAFDPQRSNLCRPGRLEAAAPKPCGQGPPHDARNGADDRHAPRAAASDADDEDRRAAA